MKNICIFASGGGSNAEKIIAYFKGSDNVRIVLIASNKTDAGVLQIASLHQIPTLIIEKEKFFRGNGYVDELKNVSIDLIVLAGFLWKIPTSLIHSFPNKIINIHPALLPKYGGKGMHGLHVHAAVLAAGEKESGISIHQVNEVYDSGEIIFQATCPVYENDSPELLAKRVLQLEHSFYAKLIEELLGK